MPIPIKTEMTSRIVAIGTFTLAYCISVSLRARLAPEQDNHSRRNRCSERDPLYGLPTGIIDLLVFTRGFDIRMVLIEIGHEWAPIDPGFRLRLVSVS